MTHARRRGARRASARSAEALDPPPYTGGDNFDPSVLRHRHDGWTPDRQTGFIDALAESGCVREACKAVGISTAAAYALRRRVEAQSFRLAWDLALDHAIQRLADAAFSRAIHGVAQPVFYQGEQIGERRRYDERLTMFLLRYRDPVRYGAWLDQCRAERAPDAAAIELAKMTGAVEADAYARDAGDPPPRWQHRYQPARFVGEAEQAAREERAEAMREAQEERRERERWDAQIDAEDAAYAAAAAAAAGAADADDAADGPEDDSGADVASTSSTSARNRGPRRTPVMPPAAPNPPAPRHDAPERRWSG